MAAIGRSVKWNEGLIDRLDKDVKRAQKNGKATTFTEVVHTYVLAGLEVAEQAAKGDEKAGEIWSSAIQAVLGQREAAIAKRGPASWEGRRAAEARRKEESAEVAAVEKALGPETGNTRGRPRKAGETVVEQTEAPLEEAGASRKKGRAKKSS